jgi:ribosomal protein S2
LKDSNFIKFLVVFKHFVGGEQAQRELIENQIKTSMRAPRERWSGGTTNHVYHMAKALNRSTEASTSNMSGFSDPKAHMMSEPADPCTVFWNSYQACEGSAFR